MKRILAIGDLHVTFSSLDDIARLSARVKAVAAREAVDAVVFLGDILDFDKGKVQVSEMDAAVRFFTDLAAVYDVYVLVGNHDYANPHQFLTDNHWMNSLKTHSAHLHVVDRVLVANRCVFCPFVPTGRFQEALGTVPLQDVAVVFAHQTFQGARAFKTFYEGDPWNAQLPPVVSGHMHKPQVLETGVWYAGKRQLLLIEIDDTGSTPPRIYAPSDETSSSDVTERDEQESFLALFRANVLNTGDPYIYCAAEKILTGIEEEEGDHLFISIR